MSLEHPLGMNVNANTYNGGPRNEISQLELNVIEGNLPEDLHGVAFFGSMCGSVNSGGLPFPRTQADGSPNPEFGSPFMNGDGMVFSFDMRNPGKVVVNSKFMRTPSFYADEATREGGPARAIPEFHRFHFENHGLARMSLFLGSRNYVNTALIPVDFGNDTGLGLMATIDNGRPFKLNPANLDLITPMGYNKEWTSPMPPFLKMPTLRLTRLLRNFFRLIIRSPPKRKCPVLFYTIFYAEIKINFNDNWWTSLPVMPNTRITSSLLKS